MPWKTAASRGRLATFRQVSESPALRRKELNLWKDSESNGEDKIARKDCVRRFPLIGLTAGTIRAEKLKMENIIDFRIMRKLEDSGFIDRVYIAHGAM